MIVHSFENLEPVSTAFYFSHNAVLSVTHSFFIAFQCIDFSLVRTKKELEVKKKKQTNKYKLDMESMTKTEWA